MLTGLLSVSLIAIMISCEQRPKDAKDASAASTDSVVDKRISIADSGYAEVNGLKMYYEVYGQGNLLYCCMVLL